jgi:hypothetical protein
MNAQDDTPPPTPGRRSRLEDEVAEILARADKPASLTDHVRRKTQRQRQQRVQASVNRFSSWGVGLDANSFLIGFVVAALLAGFLRDSSALLARLSAIVGIVCLLAPIVLRFKNPRQPTIKQWRGRSIDLSPQGPEWVNSLRDRFRKPPRF